MKILVINGPNLNMLGKRDAHLYGKMSLEEINNLLKIKARELKVELIFYQSNCEGELINFIQDNTVKVSGILINPGALTHYGYSLRDALSDSKLAVVCVHLSKVKNREDFRKTDVLEGIYLVNISGLKEESYLKGLEVLVNYILASQG